MECTPLSKDIVPTHLTLATLHRELNTYAMGIPSNRGGGNHGHLALVMPAADYLTLTAAAYNAPVNPGPNPAPGATQPQITENNRLHAAAMAEHKAHRDTETALKSMLIKAVPLPYIEELQDQVLGFATTSTLALLTHLDTNYGTVSFADLTNNLESMNKPWNGDTPIENLWSQITQAKAYAAAHNPITEKDTIMAALTNLQTSGMFSDDLKSWSLKTAAEQASWVGLKKHFNQANNHRLKMQTVAQMGYTAKEANPTTEHNNQENKGQNATPASNQFRDWKYCWSHGMNRSHNSKDCRKPTPGHIKEATINAMKGGNTTICPRRSTLTPAQTNTPTVT
jgi:hypothetical protein